MRLVKFLTFITVVGLPTYIIRCDNFSWCVSPIPFTLLEVLILVTFSVWAFWTLYLLKIGKESLPRIAHRLKGPLTIPLIVFLIVATISLFFTSDLRGGLGVWKAYFIEGGLLYLVAVDLSLREKNYFWIIKALIMSGLLVSVFTFVKFLFLVDEIGLDEAINTRISGLYQFANAVPLYLGPIIALSVSTIVSQYKNFNRQALFYLSMFSLIFMLVAIFFSGSKGGLIGVFSILIVWFAYLVYKSLSVKFKRYLKYSLILLVAFYFFLSSLVYLNIDNLVPEGKFQSNSIVNRYCIWQGTRDLLNERFIIGSGLNGFNEDYKVYKTCLGADYQYPHNVLLTFWTETGFIGLLVFLWVVYAYLRMNTKGKDEILSIGLLAALIYIFVHGLVDVPFFKNDLSVQFWILLSLVQ